MVTKLWSLFHTVNKKVGVFRQHSKE
jgi:hypothetical protein